MRRHFAYFFLTCSLILVLGHSIMPHNHVEQEHAACEIKNAKNLSIAELLKLALAHNLGANHLEEYKNCKKLEVTRPNVNEDFTVVHELDYLLHLVSDTKNFAKIGVEIFDYSLHLKSVPLRAPPVRS